MSTADISVLFFGQQPLLYGAERSLLNLLDGLPSNVRSTVMLPGNGPLVEELRSRGIRVVLVPYLGWIGRRLLALRGVAARFLGWPVALYCMFRTRKIEVDVVYSNSLWSHVGAITARLMKRPHIWHIREFVGGSYYTQFAVGDKYASKLIRKSEFLIYNSNAVCNHSVNALGLKPGKVIYNGILSSHRRQPLTKEKEVSQTVVIAGSINRHKNQKEAIEATELLVRQGKAIKLLIVGEGDREYKRELLSYVKTMRLEKHIEFTGFVHDVDEVLREAGVLVLCSEAEPFGRILVEAAAVGCPVIATKSGGAPEIVSHGKTGLLYEPGRPEQLSAFIGKLFDDTLLRGRLRTAAYNFVWEAFRRERYAREIGVVIEQVGANRSGRM